MGQKKLQFGRFSFFVVDYQGLVVIWWSVCISKSLNSFWVSFFMTDSTQWKCHLFVWSNFNFLHDSQWISFHPQSCLVLYSFCPNLLYSLIMWLMVSSLSPHTLHLLFCCVLSILALIWLVLMSLFCTAICRDLVMASFINHVHILSLCDVACLSFKTSIKLFFFPFLLSGYFSSVHPGVVSIVSGGCIQSSSRRCPWCNG